MSWLFQQPKSPFWWCGYKKPTTGKTVRESTLIPVGSAAEKRKARAWAAKRALEENLQASKRDEGLFAAWVAPFLNGRYGGSPKTLQRSLSSWGYIETFFEKKKITHPAQVARNHCFEFVDWRKQQGHGNARKPKRPVAHNSALLELKFFSLILKEAVNRGYIIANPALQLGIRREAPRVKDEMSDWHIQTIRARIHRLRTHQRTKALGDLYHVSFEIALHQACRLGETGFSFSQVDWQNSRINLITKGGRIHSAAINPNLLPLLKELAKTQERTWQPDQWVKMKWSKFFRRLRKLHPGKFDRVSFHSLRVTGISRLERAGLPESVVMSQVAHASTTVHRVYRRVQSAELQPFWNAMTPPAYEPGSPPPPDSSSNQNDSSP